MRTICICAFVVALHHTVSATAQTSSTIRDGAGLFSRETVQQAEAELAKAERTTHIPIVIESVESLRGESIEEAASKRARQLPSAVFLLISKDEHKISTIRVPRLWLDRLPESKGMAVRDGIVEEFRKGSMNPGLLHGVQKLTEALISSAAAAPTPPTVSAAAPSGSESELIVKNQVRLTLAGARAAITGAEAKARERGWKMNIAVVDEGGFLLAFARMDGARPASVATATSKAITAATFRQATGPLNDPSGAPDILLNLSLQNAAAASGGRITTLKGGVPIVVDGQVIGAIGVGGGSGDQDTEVAKAGVEAFVKELEQPTTAGKANERR
jgi:glc operon protein GlcG